MSGVCTFAEICLTAGFMATRHFVVEARNEFHPYIGAERTSGQWTIGGAAYLNSYGSLAIDVAAKRRLGDSPASVSVGAVWGYEEQYGHPIIPVLIGSYALADHVDLFAMPAPDPSTGKWGAVIGVKVELF